MCHFITLIVPDGDNAAVRAVLERYGRTTRPVDNPSVGNVLRGGERQILTTRGHCDCGTVLTIRHEKDAGLARLENKIDREIVRWRRAGWSDAKIDRAVENQRQAGTRPARRHGGTDTIELWDAVLDDLSRDAGLPYAGLLVRFYEAGVEDDVFPATRRELSVQTSRREALSALNEDEVTLFDLR